MEKQGPKKFTGPRALVAEGAIFVAGIVAACNPSPATETQRPTILPTESPTPTMTIAPTQEITPTPSLTPTPEVTPSPTPEITPVPVFTAEQVAEQIIHQKKADIDKTTITDIKTGINSLWNKYGNELSQVKWRYSPTKKLTEDLFIEIITSMLKGDTENAPAKQIIDERVSSSAGFSAFLLYTYANIDSPEIKKTLAEIADMPYDYALTSIPTYPGEPSRNKDRLADEIPGQLQGFFDLNK